VRCAKFSPDEDILATVSDDRTNRLFDLRSGKEIHSFQEAKGYATHLDFHPSGTCIGVATSDKKVKVYDIRMRRLQQVYSSHEGPVSQVTYQD
jgi:centriolar protein POC1